MRKCLVTIFIGCLQLFSYKLLIFRARGGREAEREERALWETPERKRSTKPTSNILTLLIDDHTIKHKFRLFNRAS